MNAISKPFNAIIQFQIDIFVRLHVNVLNITHCEHVMMWVVDITGKWSVHSVCMYMCTLSPLK